jgi:glycosyltransferase involved in cell wall biosynthesis
MKIAHYIKTRYPLHGYGGTERIALWVAKAQILMGHEVVFLCNPGSSIPFCEVIDVPTDVTNLDQYLPQDVDIVQLYNPPVFQISKPFLINIGGNDSPGGTHHPNTVFVSENHAKRHNWTEFVHNGIDLDEYPFEDKKEDYALFIGKAGWIVKNLPGTALIAREAGMPLYVGGGKAPFWFKNTVSYGEVDGQKKLDLLKNAACMLFPIIWDEPFGIVAIEALATGTAVIATRRGSLPEIITPECGILANSHRELVQGVKKSKTFSPHLCRERVLNHFTHMHMAKKYLHYYNLILENGKIREGHPHALGNPRKIIHYKQGLLNFSKNMLTAAYIKSKRYF